MTEHAALITGAASGIGAACAERFAAAGYGVLVADRSPAGEDTVARIRSAGGNAVFRSADVADSEAVAAIVGSCVSEFGRLDTVVNCAGIDGDRTPLVEFTEADFDRVMAVNVKGTMLVMQHAAKVMGPGAIVNISSAAAYLGMTHLAVYSASKGAVISVTRVAALELARAGIRVNAICPGLVRTGMMEAAHDVHEHLIEKTARRTPLRRVGEPSELAETAFFLGTPASSFLTGTIVAADGGMTAILA